MATRHATVEIEIAWQTIDAMVCKQLEHCGYAEGDIEAALMQGHIGPLSRLPAPEPTCLHERFDENAIARVCITCRRVIPRE